MRDQFGEFCALMTGRTTLVGQAYADHQETQRQCRGFLAQEGYETCAADGLETTAVD